MEGFSQDVCTITGSKKDLVSEGRTRISYDLSLATYRHEFCLFFSFFFFFSPTPFPPLSSGTLLAVAGRHSMFVLRSMRKHPRDFGGTFR